MVQIRVKDTELDRRLGQLADRCRHLTPLMAEIAGIMESEVLENFQQEGRPKRWPKSKRAREEGGQTLSDTGRLKKSIRGAYGPNWAAAGTNVIYAAVHQFGAKKGSFGTHDVEIKEHERVISQVFGRPIERRIVKVRAHRRRQRLPWGDIPARPFLVITDAGMEEIMDAVEEGLG